MYSFEPDEEQQMLHANRFAGMVCTHVKNGGFIFLRSNIIRNFELPISDLNTGRQVFKFTL